MAPLAWQTVSIPLAAGLYTKGDARAGGPPELDVCRDAQFDEEGGTQARYPYAAMSNNIAGGGVLSSCRRLAVVDDELLCFTVDQVYAWSESQQLWRLIGPHAAATLREMVRFATTGDQVDADRAELGNVLGYTWTQGSAAFFAALDKTTGAVIVAPTQISNAARPRLVALVTRFLLFYDAGANNLNVFTVNPATGVLSGPTSVIVGAFNTFYDVVKLDGADTAVGVCRRSVTTSYSVFSVTAGGAVAAVTKVLPCTGVIALSSVPTGAQVQVARVSAGVSVTGDLLTVPAFADVITNQALIGGSGTVQQLTAAHHSIGGGVFRCWVFAGFESAGGVGSAIANTVDTNGTIGSQSTFSPQMSLASRAFEYRARVYVWMAFAGESTVAVTGPYTGPGFALQNTYFLMRDDTMLTGKAVAGTAGGFAFSQGRLPGVANVGGSSYAWAGTRVRRLSLGTQGVGFAERAPVDVMFSFDDDAARRYATTGLTLYLAGAEILEYDGVRIVEVGHHIYPWFMSIIDAGGGSVATGTYAYKQTYRYMNARGETERSTSATIAAINNTGSQLSILQSTPLSMTHKAVTVRSVSEYWRTLVAPTFDSAFYLVSSLNPLNAANPNRYIANDTTVTNLPTFNDALADAAVAKLETNPENGDVLENIAPPAARLIVATDTRVFLADVAGDPDRVWYSRLRAPNELASFNDLLTIDVPRDGGDITAVAFTNETLIVYRATAIYAFPGDGLNNLGLGNNYGPARIVSTDVGAVNHEAVALTPAGTVLKTAKGWYLLSAGWQLKYIGAAVAMFDADTVEAIDVIETQHQVRVLTNARMLVWDYLVDQWAEWTITDGLHSVVWSGRHVYLATSGPRLQQTTYTGMTYGMDLEQAWIKPANMAADALNDRASGGQGMARVRWMEVLGEYRTSMLLRVRVARDYQYDGAGNPLWFDDEAWLAQPATVGSALQVRHSPSQGQCEAMKVRLTVTAPGTSATLATAALTTPVATTGAVWTATWSAGTDLSHLYPGEMGNRLSMSFSFETGTVTSLDIRDHFTWSPSLQRWIEDINNVGVRAIIAAATPVSIAAFETTIALSTRLVTLQAPDALGARNINGLTMNGSSQTKLLAGGTYQAPSGEGCKLTGLGLEVGLKTGLFRRLPAGQKQ